MTIAIRRLSEDDAGAYRPIRLEGLVAEPASFGATLEEDAALTDDDWRSSLSRNFVFGLFDGGELNGVAGYYIERGAKAKHRGHLYGVYVRPAHRGTGAARKLLDEVTASARENVEFLYLQVTQNNARAVRFYERLGFTIYARDPGGLVVDGTMYEDYLMMLRLTQGGTESDRK